MGPFGFKGLAALVHAVCHSQLPVIPRYFQ
jgi:hypothetical protein